MSKLRRALSMFVELDEPVAPTPRVRAPTAWSAETPVADTPALATDPAELALDDVYRAAGVSGSVAPKVQRILDGLHALTPDSRRAALLALAAADGSWSVEDVVRDVEQRVQALEGYMGLLSEHAKAEEGSIKAKLAVEVEARQVEIEEIDAQVATLAARRVTIRETLVGLQDNAERSVRDALKRCSTAAESAADARRQLKELVAFLVGNPTKG